MTVTELARLVQVTRAAQRMYFKTREAAYLEESKKLERVLDRAVRQIMEPITTNAPLPGQQELF